MTYCEFNDDLDALLTSDFGAGACPLRLDVCRRTGGGRTGGLFGVTGECLRVSDTAAKCTFFGQFAEFKGCYGSAQMPRPALSAREGGGGFRKVHWRQAGYWRTLQFSWKEPQGLASFLRPGQEARKLLRLEHQIGECSRPLTRDSPINPHT